MILLNDQLISREKVKIDIEDRGYQFGDGVYEVIRVYNGKLLYMAEHLERFKRSMTAIGIESSMRTNDISEKLNQLVSANALQNGIVYMQITRGVAPRNHAFPNHITSVLTAYTKAVERPLDIMAQGITAHLLEDFRWLRCDIKSLNLLGNVLAKQEALEHGSKEAILHRGDVVTEGSSSNVFIVKSNQLMTHAADNFILNGITRKRVLELAVEIGLPVIERAFTLDELMSADEVFITSTTQEITPIIKIDTHTVADGKPGGWTKKLQEEFEKEIPK